VAAVKLPVIDGGETCFDCAAPCCSAYVVPMSGFDVWRMVRGLQLPWHAIVEARADRAVWEAFRVDGREERLGFFLRHHDQRCVFLMTLPGGQARCGAHSSRPLACRIYPYTRTENNHLGIEMISHALCPPAQRTHFVENQLQARPYINDELAERPLYAFAVSRWNDEGRGSADEFAHWILSLYDALLPLRGADDWRQRAQRLISEFPI
jgi:Fe-S-cluster containining protein